MFTLCMPLHPEVLLVPIQHLATCMIDFTKAVSGCCTTSLSLALPEKQCQIMKKILLNFVYNGHIM